LASAPSFSASHVFNTFLMGVFMLSKKRQRHY
jgi:hypothetical protein